MRRETWGNEENVDMHIEEKLPHGKKFRKRERQKLFATGYLKHRITSTKEIMPLSDMQRVDAWGIIVSPQEMRKGWLWAEGEER